MQSYVTPQAGLNGQQGYSSMSPELLAQFQQWQAMQPGAQAAQAAPAEADSGLPSWMRMGLLGAIMGGNGPGGLMDMFGKGGGSGGGSSAMGGIFPGLLGGS